MTDTLTIIAHIEAKEGELGFVKKEVLALVEPTKQEQGCLRYELNQDHVNQKLFIFVEEWESQALWQKHMENKHLQAFVKATDGVLEKLEVYQLGRLA